MLDADGEELVALLGEQPNSLEPVELAGSPWLADLEQAFRVSPSQYSCLPATELDGMGFATIAAPLIAQHERRVRSYLDALSVQFSPPWDRSALEASIHSDLVYSVSNAVARTLVLELNVARLREGLHGNTPGERFENFVQQLRDPRVAISYLHEYPALAHYLVGHAAERVNAVLEMLGRFSMDQEILAQRFRFLSGARLVEFVRSGDSHCEGRAVSVLRFDNGRRIVYKPRPLAVDSHFNALLDWLNKRGSCNVLSGVTILDRGEYGWSEWIDKRHCTSVDEVARFYWRTGALLAVLHVLNATDFHLENLIAFGEHPILVDLETVLQPQIGTDTDHSLAEEYLDESVARTGLLPTGVYFSASGLGASSQQKYPYKVPVWRKEKTDEMRCAHAEVVKGAKNRPLIGNVEINPADFCDSILEGFRSTYRLLMQSRSELLAPNGPIAAFESDPIRVVIRPTKFYSDLLVSSLHPDSLRDGLDRQHVFDQLWVQVGRQPSYSRIVKAEEDDLALGNIPYFYTVPSGRDLWTSRGVIIKDFLPMSCFETIKCRVGGLNEDDLTRQLWICEATLSTLRPQPEEWAPLKTAIYSAQKQPSMYESYDASTDDAISMAQEIGDKLVVLAKTKAGRASWLGLSYRGSGNWSVSPAGLDLYSGTAGIAFFLAYLEQETGHLRYGDLARAAIAEIVSSLRSSSYVSSAIGAYTGLTSIVYALVHLGVIWHDYDLQGIADQLVANIQPLVSSDNRFDVLMGSAGAIAVLCNLRAYLDLATARHAAIMCGEHLIKNARTMVTGVGWPSDMNSKGQGLAGFSHGNAGIAWALLKLTDFSQDERYEVTANRALEYERSLFSSDTENWADLREFNKDDDAMHDPSRMMVAWCHGAPGVGLARLDSPSVANSPNREEIEIALRTTALKGFDLNHSLCHGCMGNLELFLVADKTVAFDHWRKTTLHLVKEVMNNARSHGWRCGIARGISTPGLMTGLAGIGYGLLRIARRDSVPSVLLLEAPRYGKSHSPAQKNKRADMTRTIGSD